MWRKAVYLINTMNSFKYLNTFQDMWMFEAGDDHIHTHTHIYIYIYIMYIYIKSYSHAKRNLEYLDNFTENENHMRITR